MNKHWQERLTVIAAIAFAALVLNGLLNRGPKIHGKTASSWVKELGSSHSDKGQAMHALVRLGSETSVPELTSALRSKGTPLYQSLWQRLPLFVKKRLPDPDARLHQTRFHAVMTLKEFGPSASDAIPSLVELLHDPSPSFRCSVIGTLAEVGANDVSAMSALQTMLQDKDLMVRNAAQAALARMPGSEQRETWPK